MAVLVEVMFLGIALALQISSVALPHVPHHRGAETVYIPPAVAQAVLLWQVIAPGLVTTK